MLLNQRVTAFDLVPLAGNGGERDEESLLSALPAFQAALQAAAAADGLDTALVLQSDCESFAVLSPVTDMRLWNPAAAAAAARPAAAAPPPPRPSRGALHDSVRVLQEAVWRSQEAEALAALPSEAQRKLAAHSAAFGRRGTNDWLGQRALRYQIPADLFRLAMRARMHGPGWRAGGAAASAAP